MRSAEIRQSIPSISFRDRVCEQTDENSDFRNENDRKAFSGFEECAHEQRVGPLFAQRRVFLSRMSSCFVFFSYGRRLASLISSRCPGGIISY